MQVTSCFEINQENDFCKMWLKREADAVLLVTLTSTITRQAAGTRFAPYVTSGRRVELNDCQNRNVSLSDNSSYIPCAFTRSFLRHIQWELSCLTTACYISDSTGFNLTVFGFGIGTLNSRRHAACGSAVEALRYKPEGCGINSRWCHWNFSFT
jgi:hypothetical protein